jgi:hypothetical protein
MKTRFTLLFLLLSLAASAQAGMDEKAAAFLKGGVLANDLYIVVAVIFLGLLFLLFRMERKLSKLEKDINKN